MNRRRWLVATLAAGIALTGCEGDAPEISPDPEGHVDPADDPEGAPAHDEEFEEMEPGSGDPAVEGDTEGRFDPDEDDDG